ncbi:sulfotransferase family 2 domain-containing protein [Erythrobacter sp. YT30]|uniref:sulfotransferase family 2 domain-containing protein n=1 Tax=Erythrobacter sp. YT30 TaxID=1735012 RepID=UPI00076D5128|nr:sulfotransferase family 2 domain-containing protein [Erythrobacter sp. YT30]KWV92967.1 hypothetical protein AUC45_02155 [Erythrobacter sp. YT30]
MTVVLKNKKLFYAAIPKVACTSIKRMLFEVENGFAFNPFTANGEAWHVHRFYPSLLRTEFPEHQIADYRRLLMVRDPIKRFLSAYSNRVVFHEDISPKAIQKLGRFSRLTPSPDLGEFIDRFEKYLAIPIIKSHCRPMVDFAGADPAYYSAVYGIHQMDAFLEDVSTVVGDTVEAGRFQTGGPKLSPGELTAKQIAKLEKFYTADYEAFSRYF